MDRKKLKSIGVFVVILILIAGIFVYIYISFPEPSEGIVHISPVLSVESREDVWVLTVDEMVAEDEKSFSAISYERLVLRLGTRSNKALLRFEVNMSDIEDSWSNEYWERRSKETVKMNRIIWRDVAGDEKLSIGDEIIIEKEGGEDGTFSPGYDFLIFGPTDEGYYCISKSLELPNDSLLSIDDHNEHDAQELRCHVELNNQEHEHRYSSITLLWGTDRTGCRRRIDRFVRHIG